MIGTDDYQALERMGLTRRETKSTASNELGQDQFLELMVAQMQNQDPLSPMENGEFIAQLAQFGTVNGVQELQKSFEGFAVSMQSNQALQASSMIGQTVTVPSSGLPYDGENAAEGEVYLDISANNLSLEIQNESGETVRVIALGDQREGMVPFSWNGLASDGTPLPEGMYKISAEGMVGNEPLAFETHISATVESIILGRPGEGTKVNVAGLGTISLSDIQQIK